MIQWQSESHLIFWKIFLRVVTRTQVEYLMIITQFLVVFVGIYGTYNALWNSLTHYGKTQQ